MSLTVAVLAKGNCTACCQQETNAMFLSHDTFFSVEHSPAWKANGISASEEIPRILRYQKVQYCMHTCPSPVPILGQLGPVHAHTSHSWRSISILSSHHRPNLPSGLFPSSFPKKILYTLSLSPKRATCPAHLILLHLIIRTILGAEYRSLRSCSFSTSILIASWQLVFRTRHFQVLHITIFNLSGPFHPFHRS